MARNISEMEVGEEFKFCKPKSYELIKETVDSKEKECHGIL